MASIKRKSERKFKITVSNGYRMGSKKISKAKTITVPDSVLKRGIGQYVAHAAEEFEREVKLGYSEDGDMTFEEYATRWLERQTKYALGTIGGYRKALEKVYPIIGHIKLCKLRPITLENMCIELRQREWRGKPIKETTVQKYLTTISAVLRDAKKNEIIQKNPARMIDLPDVEKVKQVIPTDCEAKEIMNLLLDEALHPDTFSKCLRKIYDRNGFPKEFHLHTLRHYFVSTMLHSGVDKQTVADLAGHGDTSFLERTYCHPQTILKQRAAVALSNTLFDGSGFIDANGVEQAIRIA